MKFKKNFRKLSKKYLWDFEEIMNKIWKNKIVVKNLK